MDRIAREMEIQRQARGVTHRRRPRPAGERRRGPAACTASAQSGPIRTEDAIAVAVCAAAEMLSAPLIVCFTSSGFTARKVATCRPTVPIFACTPEPETFRQLCAGVGRDPGADRALHRLRHDARRGPAADPRARAGAARASGSWSRRACRSTCPALPTSSRSKQFRAMRLTFLGTGTSFGVPQIGCDCAVCRSTDPRDKRTRSAAPVEAGGATILIDTPPELRLQLIAARHHAAWMRCSTPTSTPTTSTASTICGCSRCASAGPCRSTVRPRRSSGSAHRSATSSTTRRALRGHLEAEPGAARGRARAAGDRRRRRGAAARLPARTPPGVRLPHRPAGLHHRREGHPRGRARAAPGLDVLVLNALWWRPHPTHLSIGEAIETARALGARRTYLTHLTHETGHAELAAELPARHLPRVRRAHRGDCVIRLAYGRMLQDRLDGAHGLPRARLAELAARLRRGAGGGPPSARGGRVRVLRPGRPGRDGARRSRPSPKGWARRTTTCSCSASAARRWGPRRC